MFLSLVGWRIKKKKSMSCLIICQKENGVLYLIGTYLEGLYIYALRIEKYTPRMDHSPGNH